MTRKWPFGRRQEPSDRAETVGLGEPTERTDAGDNAPSTPIRDWWIGRTDLETWIDRRWRKPRPGGQYPFRRATDRPTTEAGVPVEGSPFFAPPAEATQTPWDATAVFDPGSTPADPTTRFDDATTSRSEGSTPAGSDPGASPWDLLGLTSEASWDDVVARHRELAKQHHPDRHGTGESRRQAEATMASINAAFNDLRRIYRLTDDT